MAHTFKRLKPAIVKIVVLMSALPASAATHYVWCGATGSANGTSFTNAYTNIPSTLTRGDTYVVAGSSSCTYAPVGFNTPNSGTTVITIRKASTNIDSGVAGYSSALVSNQAVWVPTGALSAAPNYCGGSGINCGWNIAGGTGYYTIDGNPDSDSGEAGTNCGSTCGFAIRSSSWSNFISIVNSGGGVVNSYNVIVRHVEIDNTGATLGGSGQVSQGIVNDGNVADLNGSIFDHDYIHDMAGGPISVQANTGVVTIEYTYMARDASNSGNHGSGIDCNGANLTIANNVMLDMAGTNFIGCHNPGEPPSTLNIYGNVFYQDNPSAYNVGTGTITCINSVKCTFNVFNNTFYNITGSLNSAAVYMAGGAAGSSATIENNLWYGSSSVAPSNCSGCTLTSDYNCYEAIADGSNPTESHSCTGNTNYLAGAANGNFHLASETPSNGINLSTVLSAVSNDPDGVNRASADGGTWSRGAYQFNANTLRPNPPTGLSGTVH